MIATSRWQELDGDTGKNPRKASTCMLIRTVKEKQRRHCSILFEIDGYYSILQADFYEIDTEMDIFPFLRALQARGIERVEQTRKEHIKGRIKPAASLATSGCKSRRTTQNSEAHEMPDSKVGILILRAKDNASSTIKNVKGALNDLAKPQAMLPR